MAKRLLPANFEVPNGLETTEFRLRMLTIHDVVKDYEAVMTSQAHLRGVFGPNSHWPAADLSLAQNLIDLGWHQKEFQNKTSFACTVMSLDESRCLGCIYIEPTEPAGYDAQVILWARQSELEGGLEDRLVAAVKEWIAKAWPFKRVGFPGREIAWRDWIQS